MQIDEFRNFVNAATQAEIEKILVVIEQEVDKRIATGEITLNLASRHDKSYDVV